MGEIKLLRGDSPEIQRKVVAALAVRLEEGVGCRWCTARSLRRELRAYVVQTGAPARGHAKRLRVAGEFADGIRAILATEPGVTDCMACRRARRRARAEWSANGPCPVHALCPKHSRPRETP